MTRERLEEIKANRTRMILGPMSEPIMDELIAHAEATLDREERLGKAQDIIERAAAKLKDDGWVKFNERWPDENGYYLAYSKPAGFDCAYYKGRHFQSPQNGDFCPTHWRELPEPPKDL
jgi:hypothetical protein